MELRSGNRASASNSQAATSQRSRARAEMNHTDRASASNSQAATSQTSRARRNEPHGGRPMHEASAWLAVGTLAWLSGRRMPVQKPCQRQRCQLLWLHALLEEAVGACSPLPSCRRRLWQLRWQPALFSHYFFPKSPDRGLGTSTVPRNFPQLHVFNADVRVSIRIHC
jgi:hypothetical protein